MNYQKKAMEKTHGIFLVHRAMGRFLLPTAHLSFLTEWRTRGQAHVTARHHQQKALSSTLILISTTYLYVFIPLK